MDVDIATAAAVFADRTRADVVAALIDGRALTAGELARVGGVTPATISSHLARLLSAGFVTVEAQGRHRYYRLTDERVGRAFEALSNLAPVREVRSLRQSHIASELRFARTCYDHLAGALAVVLAERLLAQGYIVSDGATFRLEPAGRTMLRGFGLDLDALETGRRSFAHPCLDWSERRHHIAGALGAGLLTRLRDLGWVTRSPTSRAVKLHPIGLRGLHDVFGCELTEQAA